MAESAENIALQEKGKRLKRRYDDAKNAFAPRASTLEVIAPYFNPSRGRAQSNLIFEGNSWMTEVYDGTGIYASELAGLFFDGYAANPATRWNSYKDANPFINEDDDAQEWYDDCTRRAHDAILAAGVYQCLHEATRDWWDFGDASLLVEERAQDNNRPIRGFRGLRCTVDRLGRFYIELDANHEPVAEYRNYWLTAWAAVSRYGEANVSEKIQQCYKNGKSDKFEFVHAVYPRTMDEKQQGSYRQKLPWASCYFEYDSATIVKEDGYQYYPFANPRQTGLFSETYGRGRADLVINDVLTVNTAKRLGLEDHALKVRPHMFADADVLSGLVNFVPGAITPVVRKGQMALRDLFYEHTGGGRPEITNIKEEELRNSIERMYFVDFFKQALQQDLQRVNNFTYAKQVELTMKMVGSHYTSLRTGLHEPLMKRAFRIMYEAGAFAPPPDIILQEGGQVEVAFDSPLSRAQRQEEGTAMERYYAFLASKAEAQAKLPNAPAFDILDEDVFDRELAAIYGVQAKNLRSDKQIAVIRGSRAEAEQAQAVNAQLAGGAEALGKVAPFLKVTQGAV